MTGRSQYANDPIPEKAIRLSEAFDCVLEAIRKAPEVLKTLEPALREYLVKNREHEEQRDEWRFKSKSAKDATHRVKEAVAFFRSNLSKGKLTAYIRDPADGAVLQLDALHWADVGGRLLLLEPPFAFEEDFLDNAPFSGNPNTFIHGAYRPIFFWRKEFELWLKGTFGPKKSGGRPTGSGYEAEDMPFLEIMRKSLRTREARSIYAAAVKVAKDVRPEGATEQSIITRLAKRYQKVFGSEQK